MGQQLTSGRRPESSQPRATPWVDETQRSISSLKGWDGIAPPGLLCQPFRLRKSDADTIPRAFPSLFYTTFREVRAVLAPGPKVFQAWA